MKITISKRFAELVTGFPKTVLFFVAGLLILSSFNLKDFNLEVEGITIFRGHPGPSKVLNSLIGDDRVKYLFGVGHNNIFIKI